MRPFNQAPITDRSRELFGTYMRRYEYVPSMRPFDALISERSRELYGEYRSRWSSRKVATVGWALFKAANGTNWVDWDNYSLSLSSNTHDMAIYQFMLFKIGAWAGTPHFRLFVDGQKTYPFVSTGEPVTVFDTWKSLGCLSINLRAGETFTAQFKSDNAADGAGKELSLYLGLVQFE